MLEEIKKDEEKRSGPVKQKQPLLFTLEEHAKRQGLGAPLLAAVSEAKGWVSGKKVSEDEFRQALNAFLNAPMGGKA